MPMKEILHRLQPIQVYIVLALSVCYFLVQFYISQTSQSITLLVQTYHMLCNIIALSGCIISIKNESYRDKRCSVSSNDQIEELREDEKQKEIVTKHINEKKKHNHEKLLRNTFGWARVDVLTMIIVCVFLTSLCFSIFVEVIQTLFHVGHHDHIDHKSEYHTYTYEICIILGTLGLVLNGICYLLIGGYTFHQGSFLHLTEDGTVYVLDRNVSEKRKPTEEEKLKRKSQRIHELSRDVCSSVMVIICSSAIVLWNDADSLVTRLIDPISSLLSIALLLTLSYPYMKEAGMILLQTIPNTIDIEVFRRRLMEKFPQIESIHDFHIWQLTRSKFVATVHIIFNDPTIFNDCINDIVNFFHEQDINIITIQPEFKSLECIEKGCVGHEKPNEEVDDMDSCLMACRQATCEEKLCCQRRSSDGSSESLTNKSKSNSQPLEQVVSVRNVSTEELSVVNQDFTSAKTLSGISEDSAIEFTENSRRLSSSLYIPSRYRKIQKTVSVTDKSVPSTSESDAIHLVSFKRVVSESVIKNDEHDELGRKPSEILVENKLLKQVNTTDNNETEDLYIKAKCDDS